MCAHTSLPTCPGPEPTGRQITFVRRRPRAQMAATAPGRWLCGPHAPGASTLPSVEGAPFRWNAPLQPPVPIAASIRSEERMEVGGVFEELRSPAADGSGELPAARPAAPEPRRRRRAAAGAAGLDAREGVRVLLPLLQGRQLVRSTRDTWRRGLLRKEGFLGNVSGRREGDQESGQGGWSRGKKFVGSLG